MKAFYLLLKPKISTIDLTGIFKLGWLRLCIFYQVAIVVVFFAPTITAQIQTNSLVVPETAAHQFGDRGADPFFFAEPPDVTQLYLPSLFTASAEGLSITEVAFRKNETPGSLDVVVPRITLQMSILPTAANGNLSQTINTAIVFDEENVHLRAAAGQGPGAFDLRFQLNLPYVYDPRLGSLVLKFMSSFNPEGRVASMDAQSSGQAAYYYTEPGGARRVDSLLLVTQFSYSAIPEPCSYALWILALLIAALRNILNVLKRPV